MSDSDTEPKEFQIKLRYKVGSEIHYTTLEKFEFLTIRDSNMIDKEKQKVTEEMKKRAKPKNWTNKADDYKQLKERLKQEDEKEYKFYIPLSSYYFTFENLQSFLNEKQPSSSSGNKSLQSIDDIKDRINDLLSDQKLTKKINNDYIKSQTNADDSNYVFKFNNAKAMLKDLFDIEVLQNSGYLTQGNEIGQGKVFIYRFLYFIFYEDLEMYFRLQRIYELDLFKNVHFDGTSVNNPGALEFLKNCQAKDDKEKIVLVKSLENMSILYKNMEYLNELYKDFKEGKRRESTPKIKSLKDIGIENVNKLVSSYKSSDKKFKDSRKEPFDIFELFINKDSSELKFKFIEDKINKAAKDIFQKYDDEIITQTKEYKQLEDNKSKFFITPTNPKKKDPIHIKDYFKFLGDNFKDNNKGTVELRSTRYDLKAISKHNTVEERKKIIKQYGNYILGDEYGNSDIDEIYSKLKADERRLSYIITYYNIFKILETFFLTNGCILHNKFFHQIPNQQDGANKIEISEKKIYVKVKTIKCINYNEDTLRETFEGDAILKPIYEIEFEEIPTYSNVIFNLNLIDKLNPDKQLEDILDNYKKEKPKGEKKIE